VARDFTPASSSCDPLCSPLSPSSSVNAQRAHSLPSAALDWQLALLVIQQTTILVGELQRYLTTSTLSTNKHSSRIREEA